MSETVLVAIISAVVSLIGIFYSNNRTFENMSHELDKAVALLQQENAGMKDDLKEHNHYAKLYAETMPVVQQELKSLNKRLEKLEK